MSTTIYLIRHGESEGNHQRLFLGQYNRDLTERGRRQAERTAQFLHSQIGRPDAIYSSDQTRAYDTARPTAERFDMPIIRDERIREIDAGLWENRPFEELKEKFADSFQTWLEDLGNARPDEGESVAELQERIVEGIKNIAQKHDNERIFLFTHATPIRVFAAHCLKKPLAELLDIPWATNASVTEAVYDGREFRLVEYSRDDFMGDLVTQLPATV